MPSLVQYLCLLANDDAAYGRHNSSVKDAVDQMTHFGLDQTQQQLLLTADERKIRHAVNDELCGHKKRKRLALSVTPEFIFPPPRH